MKRMDFMRWDGAAQQVCCDVGETRERLEGSLQAVKLRYLQKKRLPLYVCGIITFSKCPDASCEMRLRRRSIPYSEGCLIYVQTGVSSVSNQQKTNYARQYLGWAYNEPLPFSPSSAIFTNGSPKNLFLPPSLFQECSFTDCVICSLFIPCLF